MSLSFKRIIGTAIVVLVLLVALRPQVLTEGMRSIGVRSSIQDIGAVGQLIPSNILSYVDRIEPISGVVETNALSTEAIIDATNKERIKAGLIPLQSNIVLTASATIKTEDMIDRMYFEHASPDGKEISDLADQVGYDFVIVGENLARGGFVDAEDVVAEWMKSPGHRANMLSSKYQEIGAFAAKGMHDGREVWFAVQHFGTSRDACPTIDPRLKPAIDAMNKDLSQRRAQIANEKALLEGPNHPEGDAYKERVGVFNELVAAYNVTLVLSQEKIKVYNAQVAAFNLCLGLYRPVR